MGHRGAPYRPNVHAKLLARSCRSGTRRSARWCRIEVVANFPVPLHVASGGAPGGIEARCRRNSECLRTPIPGDLLEVSKRDAGETPSACEREFWRVSCWCRIEVPAKLPFVRTEVVAGLPVISNREVGQLSRPRTWFRASARVVDATCGKLQGTGRAEQRRHERDGVRHVGDLSSLGKVIIGPTFALSCWRGFAARAARVQTRDKLLQRVVGPRYGCVETQLWVTRTVRTTIWKDRLERCRNAVLPRAAWRRMWTVFRWSRSHCDIQRSATSVRSSSS